MKGNIMITEDDWQLIETVMDDPEIANGLTNVLLYTTTYGAVEALYHAGEWSDETPNGPAEYDGPVWVCADDSFQIEIEEWVNEKEELEYHHGQATHWMYITPPKKEE